jgi:HK97 family phage major capsid protein
MDTKTINENVEELKSLVTMAQSESEAKHKQYGEDIAKLDTSVKNIAEASSTLAETVQAQVEEKEALKKEVSEMTLAIARGAAKSGADEDTGLQMSEGIKVAFGQAIRNKNGAALNIATETATELVTDQVKHYMPHLSNEKQELAVKNILSEGSYTSGGMWCPVPVDARIRQRIFETSPMRQLAEVLNVNTQGMKFALDDEEFSVSNTGEVDTRVQTDVSEFGQVTINVHEKYAYPKASMQVLEDSSINLESWLSTKAARKLGRTQNTNFITGTGIEEAKGILSYADASSVETYERFKIGTSETAAAITLEGDDFIKLQSNVLEDYQDNANWLMHRLTWAEIVQLKDQEGRYLLDPLMLFNGSKLQLLGAPVKMAADMPAPAAGVLTSGTTYVAYGDFREGYTILDRLGINVIPDNITSPGFVKWSFRTRVGGGVTNFQAFKRLKAQ